MILRPCREPAKPIAIDVLARLPLAEAFYSLWRYLAAEEVLQPLFQQYRGDCHEQQLSFTELVHVVADALTRYHGSGRQAIVAALKEQVLSTQQRAVYGKLSRIPLPLAEAFLAELTGRLRPLFPPGMRRTELPLSLAALTVVVVDGKKIKRVAKRLLDVRGRPGKVFGGKLLAAYLPAEGLAVALAADLDGEANDIRLVPRLLPQVRAAVAGPRLWVVDRQFCDLDQPGRFTEDGDHYLIRFSKKTGFHPDPQRPGRCGVDARGRTFREEWGWMGAESQGIRRRYVRRIWLDRPGEEDVILVTDLLDADRYPAEDLLAVYLTRWQIETVFQKITEVFELRHLIGCMPQATVFQASLCLVMYNVLEAFRSYIAASRPEPLALEQLSLAKIFKDVHEELVAVHKVLSAAEVVGCFAEELTLETLRARLYGLLGDAWSADWLKAVPKKPRVYKPKPKGKQSGAHTSVHKILQEAKRQERAKASAQGGP
jgi:Transposase DDE domain